MTKIIHKNTLGFSLIELVVVMLIIGILASFAVPAYQQHVTKTRRVTMQTDLEAASAALENYFSRASSYSGAIDSGSIKSAVFSLASSESNKYYTLSVSASSASTYTLVATPKGTQSDNGKLMLSSSGARGWDEDDDGSTYETSW